MKYLTKFKEKILDIFFQTRAMGEFMNRSEYLDGYLTAVNDCIVILEELEEETVDRVRRSREQRK